MTTKSNDLTNAIAQNSEKKLLRKGAAKPMPKRCKFYVACGHAPTRWAWHTYLQKQLAVCDRCFKTNEYLRQPKG